MSLSSDRLLKLGRFVLIAANVLMLAATGDWVEQFGFCSGLACSPACLRAIRFDSFISEDRNYALNVCSSDTNKNTNKVGGWMRMRINNDEQQGTLKALFFKGF
jgi:hypothetical protein